MTKTTLSPKSFTSVSDAVAAIGDREHVDYMATIGGRKDTQQFHAEDADDLAVTLDARGFNSDSGDSVLIWLPQENGADLLGAS